MAREWETSCRLTFYIDDGIITTIGRTDPVAFVHARATRMMVMFITKCLRKPVAEDKLTCTASTPALRQSLRRSLGQDGFLITADGELLGIDFAPGRGGGACTRQLGRFAKSDRRRRRLAWLRNLGGDARKVARGGLGSSNMYGASCTGLRPRHTRRLRRLHGSVVRVRCGGSSLTCRLAIGGKNYEEFDPQVLLPNPPLKMILDAVWDDPRIREKVAFAWRDVHEGGGAAAADAATHGDSIHDTPHGIWSRIKGPVSAANAPLLDVGASLPRPFLLWIMDHDVHILHPPPLQIMTILKAHVRRLLDRRCLRALCAAKGWVTDEVMNSYAEGIDWNLLRLILRGKVLRLPPIAYKALEVLCCNGIWWDARRWASGLEGHGSCRACLAATGSALHSIMGDCSAMASDLALRCAAGGTRGVPEQALQPGLRPLLELGLPPLVNKWAPALDTPTEGFSLGHLEGLLYGDGSGYLQRHRRLSSASWAVVRISTPPPGQVVAPVTASLRGIVPGWFRTVPRGELMAAENAIRHCGINTCCVGDCKFVIEGCRVGVPTQLCSSRSFNAGLWRRISSLLDDKAGCIHFIKTKAHRSESAARLSDDDSMLNWAGNFQADRHCKSLIRDAALHDERLEHQRHMTEVAAHAIDHLAFITSWVSKRFPEVFLHVARRGTTQIADLGASANIGGHITASRKGGGRVCVRCGLSCWTNGGLKVLARRACRGAMNQQSHESHRLAMSAGVSWCTRCGAYAVRIPRALRVRCPGAPQSEAQANVRRRLAAGLPPTTSALHVAIARQFDQAEEHRRAAEAAQECRKPSPEPATVAGASERDDVFFCSPCGPIVLFPVRHHQLHVQLPHHLHLPPPPGLALHGLPWVPGLHARHGDGELPAHADVDGGALGAHVDVVPLPPPTIPRDANQIRLEYQSRLERAFRGSRYRALDSRIGGGSEPSLTVALPTPSSGCGSIFVAADASAHSVSPVPPAPPRRRPRGKQHHYESDFPASFKPSFQFPAPHTFCQPPDEATWTSRLNISSIAPFSVCHLCNVKTRARCKGCSRALCLKCARSRNWCDDVATSDVT